ncbi:MAG TPA: hypothetical protein DCG75_09975 [Bacteroidales bacterium]|nr:hypothetical protein [Bacteroidales bacterium]
MRKQPAFTFIEILVALTITSIVMVLGITLYMQLVSSNNRILHDYDKNQEALQLKSILNTDFERYNHIEYRIYELKFSDKNSTCMYEFSDIGILRRFNENMDTFKLEYSNLEYELQHGNTGMVTHFSFDIKLHNNVIPYSFYKEYPSFENVNSSIFK